jgi:hypothetical protein
VSPPSVGPTTAWIPPGGPLSLFPWRCGSQHRQPERPGSDVHRRDPPTAGSKLCARPCPTASAGHLKSGQVVRGRRRERNVHVTDHWSDLWSIQTDLNTWTETPGVDPGQSPRTPRKPKNASRIFFQNPLASLRPWRPSRQDRAPRQGLPSQNALCRPWTSRRMARRLRQELGRPLKRLVRLVVPNRQSLANPRYFNLNRNDLPKKNWINVCGPSVYGETSARLGRTRASTKPERRESQGAAIALRRAHYPGGEIKSRLACTGAKTSRPRHIG